VKCLPHRLVVDARDPLGAGFPTLLGGAAES
jgi:hypothetical protein